MDRNVHIRSGPINTKYQRDAMSPSSTTFVGNKTPTLRAVSSHLRSASGNLKKGFIYTTSIRRFNCSPMVRTPLGQPNFLQSRSCAYGALAVYIVSPVSLSMPSKLTSYPQRVFKCFRTLSHSFSFKRIPSWIVWRSLSARSPFRSVSTT